MSDVFSYGVVLLELLTGRLSVDKNRPSREQNLAERARPLLKDPHKLDRIMDPKLEGQYSTEGAGKFVLLAYQCLSLHPKSRPTMTNVVKTLEPLLDLNDNTIGPFVYIVQSAGENESGALKNGREGKIECEMTKDKHCQKHQKGHRHRHRIRSLRSRVIYSNTTLSKTLGTSLYSPKPDQLDKRA
ncbi:hypothetical protein I3760_15G143900 [Carya illinoinensis]|nr:hypothetical protein I3760_15G143900 [Carya illinoinensis]